MLDIYGRGPIRPGMVICYPMRRGSRCWLVTLRVTDVDDAAGRIGGWQPSGRHATIWGETVRQCAIIKGATLEAAADRRRELAAAN